MAEWTIIQLIFWAESYFKGHAIDSPRLTAEILLAHALKIQRLDLYLQHDRPLEKDELADFKLLIKRRISKEPVAYIVGEKGFYESDFTVAEGVLIPRPETETLVEAALAVLTAAHADRPPLTVLELGTGSGAVIASLARALPGHRYLANDLSLAALDIARKNAWKIAGNHVIFFAGSWLEAVNRKPVFDLIVSNPPYIPTADIQQLQPEISRFEPLLALDGGRDGLDAFRSILKDARQCMVPGGTLLFEMGFDQRPGLELLFKQYGGDDTIEFIQDLSGHDRVVKIKKTN